MRYGAKKNLAAKLKSQSPPHPARAASVIPVRGINSELPVKFAPNGGAVPGDRIVGIVTPGEGITIYPIQSPALKDFEEEPKRWLDDRWTSTTMPQRFPARILVHNVNEPGSLAQVATVIAEHDGNIDNISMSRRSPHFTGLMIDLEVDDLKHRRLSSRSRAPRRSSPGSSASTDDFLSLPGSTRRSILFKQIGAQVDVRMTVPLSGRIQNSDDGFKLAPLRSASASMSTTSPPCATHGVANGRIRCGRPRAHRGRRRRDHRASARGPPPHPRRRHDAAQGQKFKAAEFRDGRDRGRCCGFRWRPNRTRCAWRRSGARNSPPRAGSTSPASTTRCALHRAAERRRHPGVAVHRRRPRQIEMAARLKAPVIEIHTEPGAMPWSRRQGQGAKPSGSASWRRQIGPRGAGWRFTPARA